LVVVIYGNESSGIDQERMKFGQTLNVRLVVDKAKVKSRRVRCQENDNEIANVGGES
jgi:hypothetical protein